MKIRQGSYFKRLLAAFFIGGFVPFLILAIAFISLARGTLEKAYRNRAEEAVSLSASIMEALLSDTTETARTMAASPAVIAYARGPQRTAATIAEVNRLLTSSIGALPLYPCIIPSDGSAPLTKGSLPEEYRLLNHAGWGILGELTRSTDPTPFVLFAQPHPQTGRNVPIAVGTLIRDDEGVCGYLIVDIDRTLIEEKVGLPAKSGGALTEFIVSDKSDCIIYDMSDARREATFYDPETVPSKAFVLSTAPVTGGIKAFGAFPIETVHVFSRKLIAAALGIASISGILFLGMAIFMAQATARPIHQLTLTMKDVSQGKLDVSCPELKGSNSNDEVALLITQFNHMIARVNELVENKVEQERNLKYAELKSLQAQMNPHFIYNTLNSIRSVAKLKGDFELAFVTTSLARIIREGSSKGSAFCSLGHSLELARDYFAIEAWRWPGRFELKESVDQGLLSACVPRLIIQPIVENALSHGLENKPGKGVLSIEGLKEGDDLVVVVSDDGDGIDAGRLEAINTSLAKAEEDDGALPLVTVAGLPIVSGPPQKNLGPGQGIALVNTHRRLFLSYGKGYGIHIASRKGEGTTVTIRLPYEAMVGPEC